MLNEDVMAVTGVSRKALNNAVIRRYLSLEAAEISELKKRRFFTFKDVIRICALSGLNAVGVSPGRTFDYIDRFSIFTEEGSRPDGSNGTLIDEFIDWCDEFYTTGKLAIEEIRIDLLGECVIVVADGGERSFVEECSHDDQDIAHLLNKRPWLEIKIDGEMIRQFLTAVKARDVNSLPLSKLREPSEPSE